MTQCIAKNNILARFVKIYSEGAPKETREHDEEEGRIAHKVASFVVFTIFVYTRSSWQERSM